MMTRPGSGRVFFCPAGKGRGKIESQSKKTQGGTQRMEPPAAVVVELAAALQSARRAVVLTGAGASTESGLPDWRGPEGTWKNWDPARVASLTALRLHPVDFYQFYQYRLSRLRGARPNATHLALAALELAGRVRCVITQNVDGLHGAAGSRDVIEVHGNLCTAHCVDCRQPYSIASLERTVAGPGDVPVCDRCGGYIKPGVVLFEEALPAREIERAFAEAYASDLFIVVGSSLEVGPVNMLPQAAVDAGADLAIINLEPTRMDGLARWVVRERSGTVLPALARHLGIAAAPE